MAWEEIQKEWLLGAKVGYNPEEVVRAFDEVQTTLSIDLSPAKHSGRGLMFAIPIIELGILLEGLKEITNGKVLIQKIKENSPFLVSSNKKYSTIPVVKKTDSAAEYSHALAVARLATYYHRNGFEIEIEPKLLVNERSRIPDLRIKVCEVWLYIEVVSPNYSLEVQAAYKSLNRISALANTLKDDFLVEVYFCKSPSDSEILQIFQKCKEMADHPIMEQFTFEGLATIFVSFKSQEKLPHFTPAIEEKRPILVTIGFRMENKEGIPHSSRVVAKMPISDERAQSLLNHKSRQLSRSCPGMIVMDVSGVPGGFKRWTYLISKRLQDNLNRRITAVLVVDNYVSGNNRVTGEKSLIKHPNPIHSLPQFFFDITTSSSKTT